jgi:excisionase family DNA binding protein
MARSKNIQRNPIDDLLSENDRARKDMRSAIQSSKDFRTASQRRNEKTSKQSARRERRRAQKRVAEKIDSLTTLDDIARELLPAAISHLVTRLVIEPSHPPGLGQDLDRLLTPDQAAEILGVHRRWIYDHSAKLGGTKLSRRKLRIRESSLRAYIDEQQSDD